MRRYASVRYVCVRARVRALVCVCVRLCVRVLASAARLMVHGRGRTQNASAQRTGALTLAHSVDSKATNRGELSATCVREESDILKKKGESPVAKPAWKK